MVKKKVNRNFKNNSPNYSFDSKKYNKIILPVVIFALILFAVAIFSSINFSNSTTSMTVRTTGGVISDVTGNAVTGDVVGTGNVIEGEGSGLVLNLPLNGGLLDASGNNNNGMCAIGSSCTDNPDPNCVPPVSDINCPVKVSSGVIGESYNFDGTGKFIKIANSETLNIPGSLTISIWVKLNNKMDSYPNEQMLIEKADAFAKTRNYGIWVTGLTKSLQFNGANKDGTGDYSFFIGSNNSQVQKLDDLQWHHIVGIWDGTSAKLYVDDVVVAEGLRDGYVGSSSIIGGELYSSTVDVIVGRRSNIIITGSSGLYLNGSVDEIKIYNRALSSNEVTSLYTEAKLLVLNMPLDGDMADISGNENNGRCTNSLKCPSPVVGRLGQAYDFGGNRYIQVKDSNSLKLADKVSMSFWAKLNVPMGEEPTNAENYQMFVEKSCGRAIQRNYGVWISGKLKSLSFSGADDSGNFVFFIGSNNSQVQKLDDLQWHHITAVWDGTEAKLYLDNVLIASGLGTGTGVGPLYSECTGSLTIGRNSIDYGENNYYFNGAIDELKIYAKGLSVSEVANLYSSESSGLVMDLPFDNNMNDKSGMGNNAFCWTTGCPTPVIGKLGNAYKFDKPNWVYVADSPTTEISGPLTLAMWVKLNNKMGLSNSNSGDIQILAEKSDSLARFRNYGIWISGKSKSIDFSAANADLSGYAFFIGSNNNQVQKLDDLQWHYVVGTWDGIVSKLYVDGVIVAQGLDNGYTGSTPITGGELYKSHGYLSIGRGPNTTASSNTNYYLNGSVDEVKLYTRALSENEILRYCEENGGCGSSISQVVSEEYGYCEADSIVSSRLPAKTRVSVGNQIYYCNAQTLVYTLVSNDGESCTNDFECGSNSCVEGICQKYISEVKAQGNLLQRIWCFISTWGGNTNGTC